MPGRGRPRPAPSGQLHPDRPHLLQLTGQLPRDRPGGIGAAVVRDGDTGAEGKALAQVAGQPAHARREITFLITNRNNNIHLQNCHDMEDRRPRSAMAEATLCARYERNRQVTAPRSPKSAWITSPSPANPGRVNDPARITCPARRDSSCGASLLASQATPLAGWPSTPAATPVSSIVSFT